MNQKPDSFELADKIAALMKCGQFSHTLIDKHVLEAAPMVRDLLGSRGYVAHKLFDCYEICPLANDDDELYEIERKRKRLIKKSKLRALRERAEGYEELRDLYNDLFRRYLDQLAKIDELKLTLAGHGIKGDGGAGADCCTGETDGQHGHSDDKHCGEGDAAGSHC